MKTKSDFLKHMFWSKTHFQVFSNLSKSVGLILLTSFALERKTIFNFESITYSVKQRENVFAGS